MVASSARIWASRFAWKLAASPGPRSGAKEFSERKGGSGAEELFPQRLERLNDEDFSDVGNGSSTLWLEPVRSGTGWGVPKVPRMPGRSQKGTPSAHGSALGPLSPPPQAPRDLCPSLQLFAGSKPRFRTKRNPAGTKSCLLFLDQPRARPPHATSIHPSRPVAFPVSPRSNGRTRSVWPDFPGTATVQAFHRTKHALYLAFPGNVGYFLVPLCPKSGKPETGTRWNLPCRSAPIRICIA